MQNCVSGAGILAAAMALGSDILHKDE